MRRINLALVLLLVVSIDAGAKDTTSNNTKARFIRLTVISSSLVIPRSSVARWFRSFVSRGQAARLTSESR